MDGLLPVKTVAEALSSERSADPVAARMPDFLIIGAQKSGTTWLARNLRLHPQLFLPEREVHFFNSSLNYGRGLDWYRSRFEAARPKSLVGQKCPEYLWVSSVQVDDHLPNIPRRIAEHLPDVKLIAVLRDPVQRAVSSANHHMRMGRVPPHFTIDSLLAGRHRPVAERLGVFAMSDYATGLTAYLEHYEREQMKILIYEEDVATEPGQGLTAVCDFLGVDSTFRFPAPKAAVARNETPRIADFAVYYLPGRVGFRVAEWMGQRLPRERPRPKPETLTLLSEEFAEANERLFELLGRRVDAWSPAF